MRLERRNRTLSPPPDPVRRAEHAGIAVDVVLRRPDEKGKATTAHATAKWAFGSGPVLVVHGPAYDVPPDEPSRESRWRVGPGGRYAAASDGSASAPPLLDTDVVRALESLPPNLMLRTSREGVELVVHDLEGSTKALIRDVSAVVGGIAAHGTSALRHAIEGLEGARVFDATDGDQAHAWIATRAGEARLDFALEAHGLAATLGLDTNDRGRHASELDGEGTISGGTEWLEQTTPALRRAIGPAKLTLEDETLEIAWRSVPTQEQLTRAAELLATLARGVGPAYR